MLLKVSHVLFQPKKLLQSLLNKVCYHRFTIFRAKLEWNMALGSVPISQYYGI